MLSRRRGADHGERSGMFTPHSPVLVFSDFFLFLFVLCIIRFQRVPFPTTLKQIGQPNQFSLT